MPRKSRPRELKACRQCAHAKVRCEPQADGCRRCRRLNRECTMQDPGAHRGATHKPPDVARLERKLDDLAAVVTASSPNVNPREPSPSPSTTDGADLPGEDEALELFSTFQMRMAPYCPFVVVPRHMSVSELRHQKPFLFRAIMTVACRDASQQLAMVTRLKEQVAKLILVEGERSLDLLQGLLVCLSWFHLEPQFEYPPHMMVHILVAISIDLGLDRKSCSSGTEQATLEKRRAYLGCFYISSMFSLCVVYMDPPRYTNYTDECGCLIQHAGEYPSDLDLVRLVQAHRQTRKIKAVLTLHEDDPLEADRPPSIDMCIKSVERELQQHKPCFDNIDLQGAIQYLQYYLLEACLYEVALKNNTPAESYAGGLRGRYSILSSCLTSAKKFLNTFSSILPRDYLSLPYPICAAYSYILDVISGFLFVAREGWVHEYLRHTTDLPAILSILSRKIQEAVEIFRREQPLYRIPETLTGLVPRLHRLQKEHDERRTALGNGGAETAPYPSTSEDPVRDTMFQLPHDLSWAYLRRG